MFWEAKVFRFLRGMYDPVCALFESGLELRRVSINLVIHHQRETLTRGMISAGWVVSL